MKLISQRFWNCAFIQITRIRHLQFQNRVEIHMWIKYWINVDADIDRVFGVYYTAKKSYIYVYIWISDRVGEFHPFWGPRDVSFSPNRLVFGVLTAHVLGSRLSNEVIRRQIVCTWSFDQTGDEFRESRLIFDPGESSADLSFSLEIDR